MTVAMSVWAASQLLWTFYGLTRDHVYPFPALPDIGYIGYSLFAAAGLLLSPRVAERGISKLRVILDALVIAGSVFAISWVLVLGTVASTTSSGLTLAASFGYPLADLLVASFVLALGMRVPSGSRRPWLYLGLGLLVLTITDSTYISQTSQGDVGLTGTVLTFGWTAAFLLIAVASQLRTTTAAASRRRHFSIVQELLPYVPLVAALVISHDKQFRWEDPVLLVNAGLLVVLFAVQQVLIAVEKVQLANRLEDTVTRRTQELTSSEERFRSLIHSSEDAIVAKTPQGIVTDWNPAAERIYGYPADEIIGQSIEMIIPQHLREEESQTLANPRLAGRLAPNYETERTRKDGRIIAISLTTSPILVGGEVQGVSTISHDITERRLQEVELAEARDAALAASRAKSEFLATMSQRDPHADERGDRAHRAADGHLARPRAAPLRGGGAWGG